ncbi:MAG TPA: TIGR03435 family protein [Vicinamibacterales bacterium]|jgi:uncharacterized protein (TIGR03435 family)
MTRALVGSLLLSAAVLAQTRPEFEVASVRPSSDQATQVSVGLHVTGSQVRVTYMSLKDYIGMAYNVRPSQISGPDWLAQQRFDIIATISEGVPMSKVPDMLQALLAERFKLAVHREMKEFPVYALVPAKGGLKLKEAPATPPATDGPAAINSAAVNVTATGSGNSVAVDLGGGSSFTLGNNKLEIKKMTLQQFAEVLTRFVDRPVIDKTGTTASYDLTLNLSPEDYTATLIRSAINQGVSLPPQALRLLETASSDPLSAPLSESGLSLDARRAPLDVIVVDSALRTPTEN